MNVNDILVEGRYDPFSYKGIFLCGSPGSGKNTIERQLGMLNIGLKRLDLDQTVYLIQKNNVQANKTQYNPDSGISRYRHAWNVAEKGMHSYINQKLGIIIHTTGRKKDDVISMNNVLRSNFYSTCMIYVSVAKETALQRVQSRPSNTDNPADKGREVTPDYFEMAYSATNENKAVYKKLFHNNFIEIINEGDNTAMLQHARRRLNAFLHAPVTPEAEVYYKGIKTRSGPIIGRKIST